MVVTVADTGIGKSRGYLQNQIFRPFAQENSLSPGTGLGLSLVRQLTSQFRGRISVDSCLGVGTTISVSLHLKVNLGNTAGLNDGSAAKLAGDAKLLRGLRIKLFGFLGDRAAGTGRTTSGEDNEAASTMYSICKDWLQMEVITEAEADVKSPDLVMMSADAMSRLRREDTLMNVPTMVVCDNALVAYDHAVSRESPNDSN